MTATGEKLKKTEYWKWCLKARQGGPCEKCHQETKILTVDHIIPVFILETMDKSGRAKYEDGENFALLCNPCNMYKSKRLDMADPRTRYLLRKYLNQWEVIQ